MPHSIVSDICEGISDCAEACPVACINQGNGKNTKGTDFFWIDFATCIDCGICKTVCPVSGAILEEEHGEVQRVH